MTVSYEIVTFAAPRLLRLTVSYEIVLFAILGTLWTDSLFRIVRFRHPDALPETLQSVPGLAEPRNRVSLKGFPFKTVVLWRLLRFQISGVSRPGLSRSLQIAHFVDSVVRFASLGAAFADSLARIAFRRLWDRSFC